MPQLWKNDAVALSQPDQCRELFFAGVSVQVEVQSNLLKTDGHVFGNAERAAKIEIAFRAIVASRNEMPRAE